MRSRIEDLPTWDCFAQRFAHGPDGYTDAWREVGLWAVDRSASSSAGTDKSSTRRSAISHQAACGRLTLCSPAARFRPPARPDTATWPRRREDLRVAQRTPYSSDILRVR